jgi:hypothetical protein
MQNRDFKSTTRTVARLLPPPAWLGSDTTIKKNTTENLRKCVELDLYLAKLNTQENMEALDKNSQQLTSVEKAVSQLGASNALSQKTFNLVMKYPSDAESVASVYCAIKMCERFRNNPSLSERIRLAEQKLAANPQKGLELSRDIINHRLNVLHR